MVNMKEVGKSLQKKVDELLSDNSKTENLKSIVKALSSNKEENILTALVAVNKIFSQVFSKNEDFFQDKDKYEIYHSELENCWESISHLIDSSRGKLADISLTTLLKWTEYETVKGSTEEEFKFPQERYKMIINALCGDSNNEKLIAKLAEKIEEFDDVNYYTLTSLHSISDKYIHKTSEEARYNFFNLIRCIRVKDKIQKDQILRTFGNLENFDVDFNELRKLYQFSWTNFLRSPLPEKLYIQVLVTLDDKKIAYFKHPTAMADFLIESYNKGGAVALLALNALFTLIHKYNLELPDFYTRLYALFKPEIFYQKYRARFFWLTDVFLSSSHIPAYLVAAFAKKLARLCLTAPAYSQLHVIPFIGNLIIRHVSLMKMVHNEECKDMSTDPYNEDEADPAKSKAIESSLWELKTLQNHWYHKAISKAGIIESAFPKIEWDFSDILEDGYPELFDQAVKEKYKGVAINYHVPKGLLKHVDDKMSDTWVME